MQARTSLSLQLPRGVKYTRTRTHTDTHTSTPHPPSRMGCSKRYPKGTQGRETLSHLNTLQAVHFHRQQCLAADTPFEQIKDSALWNHAAFEGSQPSQQCTLPPLLLLFLRRRRGWGAMGRRVSGSLADPSGMGPRSQALASRELQPGRAPLGETGHLRGIP